VSLSAVTGSVIAGHLDLAIAVPFAAGAIGAMLLGRRLAERFAGPRLQQAFAVVAGAVAIGLLVHALDRIIGGA
jgi:uncharacterized protein